MTPGNTAHPPLGESQLFLAKHSGTKYLSTPQRSKKHSNYPTRNNSTEEKWKVSCFKQQKSGSNLNVPQQETVQQHHIATREHRDKEEGGRVHTGLESSPKYAVR